MKKICMGCFILKKAFLLHLSALAFCVLGHGLYSDSPVTATIFETFVSNWTHQYEHLYNEPKLS